MYSYSYIINFRVIDIVICYNYITDFPKASITYASTTKVFTDETNTVNVEYMITKELHNNNKLMAKITCIIIKIYIFQMHNK